MVKNKQHDNTHPDFAYIKRQLALDIYDSNIRSTIKYLVESIEAKQKKILWLEEELYKTVHGRIDEH